MRLIAIISYEVTNMTTYEKTGYLQSNFKIFHLLDTEKINVDFHFHDFHKILIMLQGNSAYCIEGRTYDINPEDIILVNAGEVHRPIQKDDGPYERIIIYISKEFLSNYSKENNDLSLCLKLAHENEAHVLRVPSLHNTKLGQVIAELEHSFTNNEYANELYHDILFLEFMVQLNRVAINDGIEYISTSSANKKMIAVMDYINNHLSEDINIDFLAEKFYISRYHLMHLFKEETGYTIGHYLTTKRLLKAKSLLDQGEPITQACYLCGFKNYSTFLRAYKKNFGCNPREQQNSIGAPPVY